MTIRDIAFPFNKGFTQFPTSSEDDDVIENNIRRILQTRRGERVMRPRVGSNVMDFVFENTGPVLRARINAEVRRAIGQGEPRAEVLDVRVQEVETSYDRTQVLVDVIYRVNLQNRLIQFSF